VGAPLCQSDEECYHNYVIKEQFTNPVGWQNIASLFHFHFDIISNRINQGWLLAT
jgi:hypothetical protein